MIEDRQLHINESKSTYRDVCILQIRECTSA